MNVIDYPKPIVIDGLPPLHCKRSTAGTKGLCFVCHQRKTYRFVGGKPVCSYCTNTEKAQKLGPSWKRSVMQKDLPLTPEIEDAQEP